MRLLSSRITTAFSCSRLNVRGTIFLCAVLYKGVFKGQGHSKKYVFFNHRWKVYIKLSYWPFFELFFKKCIRSLWNLSSKKPEIWHRAPPFWIVLSSLAAYWASLKTNFVRIARTLEAQKKACSSTQCLLFIGVTKKLQKNIISGVTLSFNVWFTCK